MPDAAYVAYLIAFAIGLLGIIYLLISGKIDRVLVLLFSGLCILAFLSVVQLNLTISQPQGRYLFAALPSFMILVAIGWGALLKRTPLIAALTVLAITGGVYALFGVEIPAYDQTAQKRDARGGCSVRRRSDLRGPCLPEEALGKHLPPRAMVWTKLKS